MDGLIYLLLMVGGCLAVLSVAAFLAELFRYVRESFDHTKL